MKNCFEYIPNQTDIVSCLLDARETHDSSVTRSGNNSREMADGRAFVKVYGGIELGPPLRLATVAAVGSTAHIFWRVVLLKAPRRLRPQLKKITQTARFRNHRTVCSFQDETLMKLVTVAIWNTFRITFK